MLTNRLFQSRLILLLGLYSLHLYLEHEIIFTIFQVHKIILLVSKLYTAPKLPIITGRKCRQKKKKSPEENK